MWRTFYPSMLITLLFSPSHHLHYPPPPTPFLRRSCLYLWFAASGLVFGLFMRKCLFSIFFFHLLWVGLLFSLIYCAVWKRIFRPLSYAIFLNDQRLCRTILECLLKSCFCLSCHIPCLLTVPSIPLFYSLVELLQSHRFYGAWLYQRPS